MQAHRLAAAWTTSHFHLELYLVNQTIFVKNVFGDEEKKKKQEKIFSSDGF